MFKMFATLIIISMFLIVTTNALEDEYIDLPDYPSGFKMRSGYLDLSDPDKKLHYILVDSEKDSENAPLILWLNGGPGCSSLGGFSQEHGPALFIPGTAQWKVNPYSFHKLANILYLESPAGVGFSYNDGADQSESDEKSAQENLDAVVSFLNKYPNFIQNDFYIMGESYAGIYIPYLATYILKYNASQNQAKINLKGFLVGNGVTDWNIDTEPATIEFAFTHALYSLDLKQKYDYACKDQRDPFTCQQVNAQIQDDISKVNPYSIYDYCFTPKSFNSNPGAKNKRFKYTPWAYSASKNIKKENELKFLEQVNDQHHHLEARGGPPCVDDIGFNTYYNRADVKQALNVRESINFEVCSDRVAQNYYIDRTKGSYYLYPNLINSGLKIWKFSGDTDSVVPFNGTEKWIRNLNLPILENWRSWTTDNQQNIGGYVTKYQGLTFLTIRGAGHMVPQYKPKESFYFLQQYLNGRDL